MLQVTFASILRKTLGLLLLVLVCLTSFQSLAYAVVNSPTAGDSLALDDQNIYKEFQTTSLYDMQLDILSNRCGTDTNDLALGVMAGANRMQEKGIKTSNFLFLTDAVSRTESGTGGLSCNQIFLSMTGDE